MKINHDRKNLPRQINHLKSPVIIRNLDHSKNERKKLTLAKLNIKYLVLGVTRLFRTPEALKSLNSKTFTRKIEQNDLQFLVPSVLFPQFLAAQHS